MHHLSAGELTLAALMLEAAVGYPAFVYRAIGHPVTWMGFLIAWLEMRLNRRSATESARRIGGVLAVMVLLAVAGAAAAALGWATGWGPRVPWEPWEPQWMSRWGPVGLVVVIAAASSLLAQRSLYEHVRAVADALEAGGLEGGREAVSMIVGRNPEHLDAEGVARAAIESLAENFSDGVVAPALWLAICGLPGGVAYKAINTADSMIGHRTPRYAAFGWAAARLDDLVNLPASRLSALFVVLAAVWVGGSPAGAMRAVWRDARHHRSPNAGWPEAAMAGALGLKLAGPRVYGETMVADAFMGSGRAEATVSDIRRALVLYKAACVVQWMVLLVAVVIGRG